MKVTDTHPAAAEHFDYLDRVPEPSGPETDQDLLAPHQQSELADLVEATEPPRAPGDRARSA